MLSPKPWRTEAVMMLVAGIFLCLCFSALLGGGLQHAHVHGFRTENSPGIVLIDTLSFHGAVWALVPVFLWGHRIHWGDAFGWRDEHLKRALGLAGLTLLVTLPVVMALQPLSAFVLKLLGHSPEDQLAIKMFTAAQSPWLRVYLGFFAVVLAPVAEEFIFRGVLYPWAKQFGFPRLAAIGVSLLFALIHNDAEIFLPLFVLALSLTWLYEKTDNLLAPIAVHSLFNATNLALLLLAGRGPDPS